MTASQSGPRVNGDSTASTNGNKNVVEPGSNLQVDIDVPVLVVGGGPVGLLMAYLLGRLGVKSLIIEKYPQRLAVSADT